MSLFEIFFLSHENHYIIRHKIIKDAILQIYYPHPPDLQKLRLRLATFLELSPHSTRKYEEICHHLYKSSSLFKLKETISSVVPFLFLFTLQSKFDLFFYWRKLNKKGFDPTIEYNNALEAYCLKFYLTPEDMFKVVFQISRFLKEFSEFETKLTPDFRHPFIRECQELAEICLHEEGNKLDMINANYSDRTANILNNYETLNVDIPLNRQVLRNHYLDIVREEIKHSKINQEEEEIVNEFIEEKLPPGTPLMIPREISSVSLRCLFCFESKI